MTFYRISYTRNLPGSLHPHPLCGIVFESSKPLEHFVDASVGLADYFDCLTRYEALFKSSFKVLCCLGVFQVCIFSYTISATANLFPTEVTLTLTLSPAFPFFTNMINPCIRAIPSPLSPLSVT
jgi:hypothetical protein